MRPQLYLRLFVSVISLTQWEVAAAQVLPPPPERPLVDENGVDIVTGQVALSYEDLNIGGPGTAGLQYIRYLGGSTWRSNFDSLKDIQNPTEHMYLDTGTVSFGNQSETFASGSPGLATGSYLTSDTYYQLNGTVVYFGHVIHSTSFQHMSVAEYTEFSDGTRWTYHYKDAPGYTVPIWRIQSITSNRGYQIKFTYAENQISSDFSNRWEWIRVTGARAINNAFEYCDPYADACALSMPWPASSYSVSGTQSTNIDALGRITRHTNGTTYSIKTPDSSVDNVFYTRAFITKPCLPNAGCILGSPLVVTSANLRGVTTNYAYSSPASGEWKVISTGYPSAQRVYESGFADAIPSTGAKAVGPLLLKYTDPTSNQFRYTYNIDQSWTGTILPEGNSSVMTVDYAGRATSTKHCKKAGCSSGFIETTQIPGSGRDKTQFSSKTDGRGNTALYTYSPSHGGVVAEVSPAVSGVQAVKRNAYQQHYAWVRGAGPGFVQATTPVWLLSETRTCRTTATIGSACAGGASDEVVTSYEYEAGNASTRSNLLLKSTVVTADGQAFRTCYGYDRFGRKVSETKPRAGLTNCL